jgi:hypothetical protein
VGRCTQVSAQTQLQLASTCCRWEPGACQQLRACLRIPVRPAPGTSPLPITVTRHVPCLAPGRRSPCVYAARPTQSMVVQLMGMGFLQPSSGAHVILVAERQDSSCSHGYASQRMLLKVCSKWKAMCSRSLQVCVCVCISSCWGCMVGRALQQGPHSGATKCCGVMALDIQSVIHPVKMGTAVCGWGRGAPLTWGPLLLGFAGRSLCCCVPQACGRVQPVAAYLSVWLVG